MIEIKDECEYCGKRKKDHVKRVLCLYCADSPASTTFKSKTEALAEKNGLKNLEVMIEKERDEEIYRFLCFIIKDFGVQKLEPFVDWLRFVKDGSTYTFEELLTQFRNLKVDK